MKFPVSDANQPACNDHQNPLLVARWRGGLTLKIKPCSVPDALRKSKQLLKKQAIPDGDLVRIS
jgi:hypothetical protein